MPKMGKDTDFSFNDSGIGRAKVLGIIGLVFWCIPILGGPIGIVGLILGIVGRKKGGRGMATAGIVMSIITIVLAVINAIAGVYLQTSNVLNQL